MNKTQVKLTLDSLKLKGYGVRSAARAIGRSAPHVHLVLSGKRNSQPTIDALIALPAIEKSPSATTAKEEPTNNNN